MSTFSVEDRLQLHELANRYGNTLDSRDWLRFQTCFTDDCRYELRGFGRLDQVIHGSENLRLFMEASTQHPVAHHVTNIEVNTPDVGFAENGDANQTVMVSKIVGTLTNGTAGSADYYDIVVRTAGRWRIADRLVTMRR